MKRKLARWLDDHVPTTKEQRVNALEKYKVSKTCLGQGVMGTVHTGIRTSDAQKVAVKQIAFGKYEHMIALEIRALRAVDHPNVIKLIDILQTVKFMYLVLEYMPGTLAASISFVVPFSFFVHKSRRV